MTTLGDDLRMLDDAFDAVVFSANRQPLAFKFLAYLRRTTRDLFLRAAFIIHQLALTWTTSPTSLDMSVGNNDFALILKECLDTGTSTSWDHFVALAQPIVAGAIVRALARWGGAESVLADDLIQDTFVKLCAKNCHVLRSFRGTETTALCAYLRTVASSIAADHFNSSSAIKHGGKVQSISLEDLSAPSLATSNAPMQEIESNLILSRVENCLSSHKDRDRNIFWLYHRHGYTPEDISHYPGIEVSKGGVETIIYRLTKAIRDCVNKGTPFAKSAEGANA